MSTSELDLACVQVKQEKIDAEVEARMRAISAFKVKSEPDDSSNSCSSTPPRISPANDQDDEDNLAEDSKSNDSSSTNEDKKCIQPLKSSNEILAELFKVFNAKPPEELLDDKSLIKKSLKRKKHKKEKKKHHKKAKLDDGEVTDDDKITDKVIAREHKKKKRHKHKDKEKDKSKHKDKEKSRGKTKERDKHKERSKSKEKAKESGVERIHIKTERKSPPSTTDDNSHKKREVTRNKNSKEGFVIKIKTESLDSVRLKKRSAPNHRNKDRDRDRERDKKKDKDYSSETSLSDEETYLRERERVPANRRDRYEEHEGEHSRRYNSFYNKTETRNRGRSRDSDVDPRKDYNQRERRRREQTRSASHSRSRSRDLGIDKKKLLEIARKNAISMFKRGNLPGCADMSEEIKDKVLLKMRYGGRTVQDLTEFCKKISNGEHLSDLSSDEDSDVDKGGNVKAFHHPFLLKEREPIVMNIRNAVPLPVRKTDDQTKAITMQFPVSSGQQHRVTEAWVPVEKKNDLTPLPALPAATQSTNIFKSSVPKNVFQKPMPPEVQQEPAFKALMPAGYLQEQPTAPANNAIVANSPVAVFPPPPPPQPFVPDVPVPSASTPTESVFPQPPSQGFDVSSIITKRLNAMRRLQDNPLDAEALKMMFNSQKEMSSWVSSKHMPGQFTGSTGANVLKVHELNNGPQIWARRDQLIATQPVSGGMGMHLLQKMGWKPGEGLGPQKSGSLQPLLLDVKLDKRGLVSSEDHDHRHLFPKKQRGAPTSIAQAQQDVSEKHPVCLLNELTSKRKWTPPLYTVVNENGPAHSKMFLFSVQINGHTYMPDRGSNTKKEAKMLAAKHCLQQIGVLPN